MAIFPRGKIYWYKFCFAGQLIRESSKSTSKTVAKNAESQRRRGLEQGFNNVQTRREIRIRQLRDVAEDYFGDYRLRFRGVTFAEYAIGHVVRHLGEKLLIDIEETTVPNAPAPGLTRSGDGLHLLRNRCARIVLLPPALLES